MPDPRPGRHATARGCDEVVNEDRNMSDLFKNIKHITPPYPIKPVRPAQKDRQTGKREQKREPQKPDDRDDEDKPLIDEHV